jgi:hypothetical protein
MANLNVIKNLSMATVGTAFITLGTVSTAQAVVINFDTDADGNPITAPSFFIDSTVLTDLYAPLGINFSGSGQLNGGSVLDQLGNFGVNALSGSNFLAFNRDAVVLNGSIPTDPEIISFSEPIANFSVFASGGFESTSFQLQAFDINNSLLGTNTIATAVGEWEKLRFSSSLGNISQVVLTEIGGDNNFVYDNLSFQSTTEPVPEPLTILSSLTAGAFGVAFRRKNKHKEKL